MKIKQNKIKYYIKSIKIKVKEYKQMKKEEDYTWQTANSSRIILMAPNTLTRSRLMFMCSSRISYRNTKYLHDIV